MILAFCVAIYEWIKLSLKSRFKFFLIPIGLLYIAMCFYAFFVMREGAVVEVIVLLFMVWASDIGAYFTGKLIGGPKMAKTISPNKTWSGFVGAILSSTMVSIVWFVGIDGNPIFFEETLFFASVFGIVIGLSGQIGDLLISAAKRLANVKDTGQLIPGHGGLLDRIDSLMLASVAYFICMYMFFAYG